DVQGAGLIVELTEQLFLRAHVSEGGGHGTHGEGETVVGGCSTGERQTNHGTCSGGDASDQAVEFLSDFLGRSTGTERLGGGSLSTCADGVGTTCGARSAGDRSTASLVGADFAGSHAVHAQVDGFVGVSAHLESSGTERTVQQLLTTEAGGFGDTVQFSGQLTELGLHGLALFTTVGAVGRLQGQFAHALQDGGGLTHDG